MRDDLVAILDQLSVEETKELRTLLDYRQNKEVSFSVDEDLWHYARAALSSMNVSAPHNLRNFLFSGKYPFGKDKYEAISTKFRNYIETAIKQTPSISRAQLEIVSVLVLQCLITLMRHRSMDVSMTALLRSIPASLDTAVDNLFPDYAANGLLAFPAGVIPKLKAVS